MSTDNGLTDLYMDMDNMIATFHWFADYCNICGYNHIIILWHGGEPLLIQNEIMINVLEAGSDIFKKHHISYEYRIQSNLINVNINTIDIIKKYFNGHVGGSFDYMTDARHFKNGDDSSDVVLNNINLLKKHGVNVGVITMLTPNNINHLQELYSFFKNNKIGFQVSRVLPTAYEKDVYKYMLTDEMYAKSIIKLFDIWFYDKNEAAYINTFVDLAYSLITKEIHVCEAQVTCQPNYIGITPDGSLFPCGRFSTNKYCVGNIHKISPCEYATARTQLTFNDEYQIGDICMNCKYFLICHGGCLYERVVCHKSDSCAKKLIYAHIESKLVEKGLI